MTNSPRTRKGSASRVLAVLAAMAIALAMIPLVAGGALADHREPARFDEVVNLADADSNIEAAVAWSQETHGHDDAESDNALIGRSDVFADSLSSGGVQCAVDGPLLLTPTDGVAPETEEELNRLGVGSITIMGGETAISEETEDALNDAGFETERVSGPTRIETAQDAAAQFFADADTAIVARAYGDEEDATRAFADSLAAGAAACEAGIPILLTQTEELTETLSDYLAGSAIENVFVVGGRGAVSDETVGAIEDLGISTERVSGSNRAATAVAVAEEFFPGAENATLVDGFQENSWASGFPAALFAARNDSPIVLVGGGAPGTDDPDGGDADAGAGRLQEDPEGGEEECVIPQETLDYLDSIFTEDSTFTLGPFTDNCIEDLLAAHFGFDELPSELPTDGTASPTGSPTVTASPTVGPNTTFTTAPELVSCVIEPNRSAVNPANGVVRYTFDSPVSGQAPTPNLFHIYRFTGQQFSGNVAAIVSGTNQVLVEFPATQLQNSTVCTVDFAAVRAPGGLNNPEGDAAIQNVIQAAGITEAPDLEDITSYRTNAQGTAIFIDYVFDEAVANTPNAAGFQVLLTDGSLFTADALFNPAVQPTAPFSGDSRTVTARFPFASAQIPEAGIARGIVVEGTVSDASGNFNPLQTVDEVNNGNTSEPDLVSATVTGSTTVDYLFDQPVSAALGTNAIAPNPARFGIYDAFGVYDTGQTAVRSTTNPNIVTVTFTAETGTGATGNVPVPNAVGAFIYDTAVSQAENANIFVVNEDDEVPLQQVGFQAGSTLIPDLVSVRIFNDPVTQARVARYTFDQRVDAFVDQNAANGEFQAADFSLYDANGTLFVPGLLPGGHTGPAGGNATVRTVSGDNLSVDVFGYSNTQGDLAVIGTVDDADVNAVPPAGANPIVPEGVAPVTR